MFWTHYRACDVGHANFGGIYRYALCCTRQLLNRCKLHVKGFVDATNARFSSNPHYQFIQINLQENLLKSFLVNLFANSLRNVVPPSLQANYLVSSQNMEYVREPLGMTNSKVGYVYLIDENLRIRWGGCADATAEESQALESCTGVLLKRLEKKPKGGHLSQLEGASMPSVSQ